VRLRGERFGEEASGGEYIGLLAIGTSALNELPQAGCLIGDFALPRLRRGGRVLTSPFHERFAFPCDDLTSYLAENLNWLSERNLSRFATEDAHIEPGIELDRALVGVGARVSGQGTLRRVLVLPGARCEAPLTDAIVAPSGRIIRI
jgi:hypothetical protein